MEQPILDTLGDLDDAANLLKARLVAKDELVELLITCAVAQEHLLIVGRPGTGKSEIVKRFALLCTPDGAGARNDRVPYFEYLLTRFTEPNEIFGPIDIAALQQGAGTRRNTKGMLPRAEIAFFDEVFKANSAILNALLAILNERIFYNGGKRDGVPLICAIGATNSVPDDEELAALYDRFLLRVWTDNVEESLFPDLFQRGWKLEQERIAEHGSKPGNVTTTDALRTLHQALSTIDLSPVVHDYREVVRRIRAEGIALSDRRVIKLLKLIAASALRHRREAANPGDFWLLRHVWNDPEQIPHLQTIINPYVESFEGETYSAERALSAVQDDLELLEARGRALKTDTDYADFLQQLEALRRELQRHSAGDEKAPAQIQAERDTLLKRIEEMIDGVMKVLEDTL